MKIWNKCEQKTKKSDSKIEIFRLIEYLFRIGKQNSFVT